MSVELRPQGWAVGILRLDPVTPEKPVPKARGYMGAPVPDPNF